MSQWIKDSPIRPIHIGLFLVATYFALHKPSLFTLGVCLASLVRLLWQYGWRVLLKCSPIFIGFSLLFCGQIFWIHHAEQNSLTQVSSLQVLPDTIKVNGDSLSFRGKSADQTFQVFYQLKTKEEKEFFQRVTSTLLLEVEAEVEKPTGQRNFNGFDYRAYLKTQGIYRTVKIEKINKVKPIQTWNPLDYLSSLRRKALVHIQSHFPAPMSHYMTGLLFGELNSDFDQMSDIYTSLGIIHLFALSGMQVGFFIDKIRYLLLRLGLKKETVDKAQIPLSFVYAGLTGFSVSVVRSLIQKIVGNAGITKLDNLAITLLISFVLMPNFLLTTGGVLSFSYAFLLTVFDFEHLPRYRKVAMESLALSLGILPLLIFYFSSFQPLSILLTFAFSFIFDVLMLPVLSVIFLLSPLIVVTQVNLAFVWLEDLIVWISHVFARPLVFGKPSILVLLTLVILLGLLYDNGRAKKPIVLLVACTALLFFITKNPLTNEVTVVDIGQGDSIFLRDIRGRTILIDVGGKVEFAPKEDWQVKSSQANAERTLIPYLRSRGVDKIDSLVLTHADTDHVGDVEVVAKAIKIGKIYVSESSLSEKKFVESLKRVNVPVEVVKLGQKFPIMDSFLEVLYPERAGEAGNNDSIVLYGNLLGKNFLFTGDLEDGELDLIQRYPNLQVDVLKAGHHGSKGSSYPEFLAHIKAKVALISAGEKNRYQHPHPETLKRFEKEEMTVYRTDQQGAIRFTGIWDWQVETVR